MKGRSALRLGFQRWFTAVQQTPVNSDHWCRAAPVLGDRHISQTRVRQHNCLTWRPPDKILGLGEIWSYTDVTQWPDQYQTCTGARQSPVNLRTSLAVRDTNLPPFSLYNFHVQQNVQTLLVNNGHSAQVTYRGGQLSVSGGALNGEYEVVQYHFHWGGDNGHGSEHTVDGRSYPMEMHVVTFRKQYGDVPTAVTKHDGLAVLGFFFEISPRDNPALNPLVDALEKITDAGTVYAMHPVALGDLLPGDLSQYYRYQGGLTTPPCSESVLWSVFKQTIPISARQMNAFRALRSNEADASGIFKPLVDNYRPIQPLRGRIIRTSF